MGTQVDELVIIPDVTAHIMVFRIMRFQLFHRSCSFMFAPWGAKEPVSQEAGSAMSVTLTWKANPCKWAYVILSDNMRCARMIELVSMLMRGAMRARTPHSQHR